LTCKEWKRKSKVEWLHKRSKSRKQHAKPGTERLKGNLKNAKKPSNAERLTKRHAFNGRKMRS
jgi:hypothetical protein